MLEEYCSLRFQPRSIPKWMYSYDSSVTRAQREMTHHLVVYAFLPRPTVNTSGEQQYQTDSSNAVVLARHASPAFLLVSYRRARTRRGCQDGAINASIDNASGALSGVQRKPTAQQNSSRKRQQPQQYEAELSGDIQWDQYVPAEIRGRDAIGFEAIDDESSMWQVEADLHTPGFLDKARHLLILWQFQQRISLEDVGFRGGGVESCVRSHWLELVAALRTSPPRISTEVIMESFLIDIFEQTSIWRSSGERSDVLNREKTAVQVAAKLFLRGLFSGRVKDLFRSAIQVEATTASTRQLHDCFVSLVLELYNYICCVLEGMTVGSNGAEPERSDASLMALLDDILSLVYGCARFGELRRRISALLMDTSTPASLTATLNRVFQEFTGHVYRATTASAVSTIRSHQLATRRKHNTVQSSWSRRWLLEPGSVEIVDLRTNNHDDHVALRLVDVAQVLCEFGCVDVAADAEMFSVLLHTGVLFSENESAMCTEIILDGQRHINCGQSSALLSILAGRRCAGEYAGSLSDDGRSLHLDYFYQEDEHQSNAEGACASAAGLGKETRGTEGAINGATMVRQVKITLSLDHEPSCEARNDDRDLLMFVHAVTSVAAICPTTDSDGRLLKLSSSDRAALEWTQVTELQAGYVAVS